MHVDFYADGVSSMTPDREILSGRPFGGLGIMWRKSLGSCITIENQIKSILFRHRISHK